MISHLHTTRLFARLLGIVYLVAFASLWVQIHGLVGEQGILPAQEFLDRVAAWTGPQHSWRAPTLCWWVGASDMALSALCLSGVIASLFVILGATGPLVWGVLWGLYLSLCTVGQLFLGFHWDNLLLEVGLIAVLLFDSTGRPNRLGWWLVRLLLVKLMVLSGLVKILSEDPAWLEHTALNQHFWTQPLPNPLSWTVHHWSPAVKKALLWGMWFGELVLPFFAFGPRWARRFCFLGTVGLMGGIAATGNYGFFNLLTCVLALSLLDDADLKLLRRSIPLNGVTSRATLIHLGLGAALLFMSGLQVARRTVGLEDLPKVLETAVQTLAPFRSVNSYGLFAVMTPERPEIIIEGSHDGQVWQPYELPWKPGEPTRKPGQVAPHMPRLDWQLWFAALGGKRHTAWVRPFLERIQEASPTVLALIEHDPFGGEPPAYLRARLYRYTFTTPAEQALTGQWWTREYVRELTPVLRRR